MGGSGSGKTTLLKICAGLADYQRSQNRCRRFGRFSMVFQQNMLLDYMTISDNILLPATLQGSAANSNAVVKTLRLTDLMDRYPFQLSGGQQKRVAIARALLYPGIRGLIMDEPLTGLDEPLKEEILRDLLGRLESGALACLFATHSPFEAVFLADRIVFLGGSPATIVDDYSVNIPHSERAGIIDRPEFYNRIAEVQRRLRQAHGMNGEGACID